MTDDGSARFETRLGEIAALIETLLDRLLGPGPLEGERARAARLLDAVRYASLGVFCGAPAAELDGGSGA